MSILVSSRLNDLAGENTRHIFVIITMILSMIYPLTTIVVFIIHCYASSLAFDLIRKEIERCEIQIINGREKDISFFLSVIKQKYLTACDAVDSINRTFGRMLLLSTTFFIVAVINIIYLSFSVINGNMSFADKVFITYNFVHLTFIFFAADYISNKVFYNYKRNLVMKLTVWCFPQAENMIKELMRLKCADEPLKGNEMEVSDIYPDF
jgi:hypothetical protein